MGDGEAHDVGVRPDVEGDPGAPAFTPLVLGRGPGGHEAAGTLAVAARSVQEGAQLLPPRGDPRPRGPHLVDGPLLTQSDHGRLPPQRPRLDPLQHRPCHHSTVSSSSSRPSRP